MYIFRANPINENLWPEWSDGDINAEKWEAGARKGDKGRVKNIIIGMLKFRMFNSC